MKIRTLIAVLTIAFFSLTACKKEVEKTEAKKEIVAANYQTASFAISGMTCEIGCAKTIQSKLNKQSGVADAKVIFTDSLATVKYDANITNASELENFINGIAGGDMYSASVINP